MTSTHDIDIDIAVIVGSARRGRLAPVIADWVVRRIEEYGGLRVDLVDVADPVDTSDVDRRLDRAQAFVIVTPEYNHSFPAPLKELLDQHRRPWQAKPFGFVSYGGISGGLRAVEHLRGVVAELHGATVRDGVSLAAPWEHLDDHGVLDPPGADVAAKVMLDQLVWWTHALTDARARTPYAA